MNGAEILQGLSRLDEYGVLSVGDFYDGGLCVENNNYSEYTLKNLDEDEQKEVRELLEQLGETEQVANDSPDAEWDYYSRVVTLFKKHGVYIETRGHYTSYVGTEYEDGFGTVVTPVKKVFTVYEEVK